MVIERLIGQLKSTNSPCSLSDFNRVAQHYGFVLDHITGSHYVYRNWTGKKFIAPVHNKKIKSVYEKMFLKDQA